MAYSCDSCFAPIREADPLADLYDEDPDDEITCIACHNEFLNKQGLSPIPLYVRVRKPEPNWRALRGSLAARLATFSNWPKTSPSPRALAEAGLIYKGQDDVTQCVFCYKSIRGWEETDEPVAEHERIYPGCLLVTDKAAIIARLGSDAGLCP